MKAALLLLSLLTAATAVPKTPTNHISWDHVHAFIAAQAIDYTTATESALWNESINGQKTWTISDAATRIRRDGGGLGWPKNGNEITFSTIEEAEYLGAMIDQFRNAHGPQAPHPKGG